MSAQFPESAAVTPRWSADRSNPLRFEDTPTYDGFPSVAYAPNGDLVAVARRATDHMSHFGDIVQWRSTNGGATWSVEGTIFGGIAEDCDLRDTGLQRMANDELLLVLSIRAVGGAGASVPNGCRWATSRDNGASWSALHTLHDGFLGFARCSTRPCLVDDGSLLWCIYGNDIADRDPTRWLKIYRSTDDAASWSHVSDIGSIDDAAKFGEASIVQSPTTGALIALVRNDSACALHRVVSLDGGTTWTALGSGQVLADACSSPKAAYTGDGLLVATQRAASHVGYLVFSADDGATWRRGEAFPSSCYLYGDIAVEGRHVVVVWAGEAATDPTTNADVFANRYTEFGGPSSSTS
jgi:hypothetical protein